MLYEWTYNTNSKWTRVNEDELRAIFIPSWSSVNDNYWAEQFQRVLEQTARGEWYTTGTIAIRALRDNGEFVYANEDAKFWRHSYIVNFTALMFSPICVNADHEQDALEYAAKKANEWGYAGYFCDYDEAIKDFGEDADEWAMPIDNGLYVNPQELYIKRI